MAKKKNEERFIIGDIVWNKHHWQLPYPELRSGHRYITEGKGRAGHDSINFDFNKKVDDNKYVFGYVPFTGKSYPGCNIGRPISENAVLFLWTKNLDTKKGQIVGVYGGYRNVKPEKRMPHTGFSEGEAFFNVKAEKEYSTLFPVPLDSKKYLKLLSAKRLIGQAGFRYIDQNLAETIITDELNALSQSATELNAYKKLRTIYEYITGSEYKEVNSDEEEQEKLENLPEIKTQSKQEIINELQSLTPQTPVQVTFRGKSYKRDNKTIAQIKKLRGKKCQICGHYILQKDGGKYVEAAHITAKSEKGVERPHNILILCPNHHKEFDYGEKKIIEHTKDRIIVDVNGKRWEVDLSLDKTKPSG